MSVHTTGKNSLVPIYGGVLPTFTRATTATRVNAAGLIELVDAGVARITHDPVTLECLGYLAEGSRTNPCLRSEAFDNASWNKTLFTIDADVAVAPDGATTADRVTNGTGGTDSLNQAITTVAGSNYSFSVFLKADSGVTWIRMGGQVGGGDRWDAYFDIVNGVKGSTGSLGTGTAIASTIEDFGNGWYRCSVTGNHSSGTSTPAAIYTSAGDGNTTRVAGSFFAWGAQFELGAFPSSYIPTTTASVTRNTDVLTYPTTGWAQLGVNSGAFLVEWQMLDVADTAKKSVAVFSDSGNNRLALRGDSNGTTNAIVTYGTGSGAYDLVAGAVAANTSFKMATTYGESGGAVSLNGAAVVANATATDIGSPATLFVSDTNGGAPLYGPIARVEYYAQRLTNAQLVALSNGEDIGITPDFLLDFATTSLTEQTGNLDHARIGYHNPARDLTATASSAADDFPADAPQRPDTYESWKPETMPAWWQVDFGETVVVDYLGIAAHELGTKGCTVTVQYSADASTWYDASDAAAPTDDSPLLLLFSPQAARHWRILLEQAASPTDAPEVGVIYLGRILTMPRPIYGGHAPITLARETVLHQSLSRGGHFLGQGFRRTGFVGQASYRHLTAAWYREHFDPFVLAARRYPYFFAWRPGTFADECAYVWTDEDIRPSNMGLRDFMAVSWPMRGFAHA